MIRSINESCCPGHSATRRFQQPERVAGRLPSNAGSKNTAEKKKQSKTKQRQEYKQTGLGIRPKEKKKKL